MSIPDETADEDRRGPLAASWERLVAFASTELGGWSIVGGLALVAGVLTVTAVLGLAAGRGGEMPIGQTTGGPVPAGAAATAVERLTLAPEALRDLSFADARAWNARLPFSTDPIPAARPFFAALDDPQSYSRALDCLTAAIYYEAGSETPAGQAAVAQVVLNRARHPAYPRTVCGVVFQGSERSTGCQFTFTCDGALTRPPSPSGWARARSVATGALNGQVMAGVGFATHYHTDWVAPYWAPTLSKVVQIGTHIFYRWRGGWGLPPAFTGVYRGQEPLVAKMGDLATPLEELLSEPAPEILVAPPIDLLVTTVPEMDASPLATAPSAQVAAEITPPPPPAPSLAEQAATRATQRDTVILADPSAPPGPGQQRPRPRIAAPSSW